MSKLQFLTGDVYESLVADETMLVIVACYFLIIATFWKFPGYCVAVAKFLSAYIGTFTFESIYRTVQIVLNIHTVWGLSVIGSLSESMNIFGINAVYSDRLEYFIFLHYISKILACFDTVFLLLSEKGRQNIKFQHVYEYASIIMILGTLLKYGHGNGTVVKKITSL